MEFTHEELTDTVKRLLALSVEQRANIDALTLGVAVVIHRLAPTPASAEEIIKEFAEFVDAKKPELQENLLIEMEDEHAPIAADLSQISAEMQEFRKSKGAG